MFMSNPDIKNKLENLKNYSKETINTLEKDINEISSKYRVNILPKITKISSKYPDQNEILEFIIEIEDYFENKNNMYINLFEKTSRRTNEILQSLTDIIYEVESQKTKPAELLKLILDNKLAIMSFTLILIILIGLINPEGVSLLLSNIKGIFTNEMVTPN